MNELLSIVEHFHPQGTVSEIRPLGSGLINDTYKVVTAEAGAPDYVLQRINHAIFQDVDGLQRNIEVVTSHIRRKLEPVPSRPRYILTDTLEPAGIPYEEVRSMEEAMPKLDVLYMTRVQKERFFNEADYIRLKDTYILTPDKLETAKSDLVIMHPLPRVNEISVAVDQDPRAHYFDQVKNGKYMRMALILKMLEVRV